MRKEDAPRVVGCLYLAMFLGAILWMQLDGALERLPALAVGTHGVPISAASGLCAGLLLAALSSWLAQWSRAVCGVEKDLSSMIGTLSERGLLLTSVGGALAEEFLFRGAAQEAFGAPLAVACYVGMSMGAGPAVFVPMALVTGALLSTMVHAGLGLLSVTSAHAIANYLSLHRIQNT
ncbi:MAG: hypothetical protein Fur0037_16010 [Planctomycetota bacterium]